MESGLMELAGCHARFDSFRGWPACVLENEYVRLVALPEVNGRISTYSLGPHTFVVENGRFPNPTSTSLGDLVCLGNMTLSKFHPVNRLKVDHWPSVSGQHLLFECAVFL